MYRVKSYEASLIENFKERYEIKDPFENVLESLIRKEIETLDRFYFNYVPSRTLKQPHKNQRTGANVKYVSPQELPQTLQGKVLGLYNSATHTILIANNLSPKEEKFVYFHEEAHAVGIIDERLADEYAAAKVGYMIHRNYDYGLAA